MKFGVLKSQIESVLVESYKNEQLKKDMFIFDELVLKNKNISKLYYLYDELTANKGLNESIANDFINQSIVVYENTINKIKPSELKEIELWVGHIECENQYKNIDDLFSSSVLNKRGIGRNPRTGKEVRVPPGRTIRFKPGKDLQSLAL